MSFNILSYKISSDSIKRKRYNKIITITRAEMS